MGCRNCPKCDRPKACDDELCIMCELKEVAIEKAKSITSKVIHRDSPRENQYKEREVYHDKGTG